MSTRLVGDCAIVRSILQVAILQALIDSGHVSAPVDVIHLACTGYSPGNDPVDRAIARMRGVSRFEVVDRASDGLSRTVARLARSLRACRARSATCHVANTNALPVGLALKLTAGLRVRSFDDGAANVMPSETSFHARLPSRAPGFRGRLARWMFPEGISGYVLGRVERHFTIFRGLRNVVPDDRLEVIDLDWHSMLDVHERQRLPRTARRILIGSCWRDLEAFPQFAAIAPYVERLKDWADLYIPHPRDETSAHVWRPDSPAESILAHYASPDSPLQVAHVNSTVALSFQAHSGIEFFNLMPTGSGMTPSPHIRAFLEGLPGS